MDGYRADTYGEAVADIYDQQHPDAVLPTGGVQDAVACLAAQADAAGGGPALELGVGTGRVAIPLAATGLEVHGIDTSPAMLARLAAKPGGDRVVPVLGDIAALGPEGLGWPFGLVYVVFNTFFLLPGQDAQVACLEAVAGLLRPGGRCVVEAFVPDPSRFDRGQRVEARAVTADGVVLDVARHDAAAQRVEGHHVYLGAGTTRLVPFVLRYAWPGELDLMARLAGLEVVDRWSRWDGAPFDGTSQAHVSVYQRTKVP